jgi:excisionase family DNA binding protein
MNNPHPSPTSYLTLQEVAALSKFSVNKIRDLVARGRLLALQPDGREQRIPQESFDAWMSGRPLGGLWAVERKLALHLERKQLLDIPVSLTPEMINEVAVEADLDGGVVGLILDRWFGITRNDGTRVCSSTQFNQDRLLSPLGAHPSDPSPEGPVELTDNCHITLLNGLFLGIRPGITGYGAELRALLKEQQPDPGLLDRTLATLSNLHETAIRVCIIHPRWTGGKVVEAPNFKDLTAEEVTRILAEEGF